MSLLDRSRIETLAAVAGDDSRAAHSMPGWYYNDPAMFEQEKSSLFADGWVCAGHASEIAISRTIYGGEDRRRAGGGGA